MSTNRPPQPNGPGRTRQALDIGGLVNLLARFKRHLADQGRKVTAVQNRLIMKRIEAERVHEPTAASRASQLEQVSTIVADILCIPSEEVHHGLANCRDDERR